MERLTASVQYGDWEGSAAADNADKIDLADLLRDRKVLTEQQFLVGVRVFVGENHDGKVRVPFIEAYAVDKGDFDSVKAALASTPDPLDLKRVKLELTMDEFLGLFKRLEVVLTRTGLALEDREFRPRD